MSASGAQSRLGSGRSAGACVMCKHASVFDLFFFFFRGAEHADLAGAAPPGPAISCGSGLNSTSAGPGKTRTVCQTRLPGRNTMTAFVRDLPISGTDLWARARLVRIGCRYFSVFERPPSRAGWPMGPPLLRLRKSVAFMRRSSGSAAYYHKCFPSPGPFRWRSVAAGPCPGQRKVSEGSPMCRCCFKRDYAGDSCVFFLETPCEKSQMRIFLRAALQGLCGFSTSAFIKSARFTRPFRGRRLIGVSSGPRILRGDLAGPCPCPP